MAAKPEVLMMRTVYHKADGGHGKELFHFFMKRPTKKAKALIENGTLYDTGCPVSAQFVKDNPGWAAIGCEDDAHAFPNQGIAKIVREAVQ